MRGLDDVGRDVRDLLLAELAAERRHHALAVRDAVDHQGERRLLLVEIRPDGARRAGVLERVAALATGRGEVLEPVNLFLSGYKILLINPGIHINTGEAFKQIKPAIPEKKIKEIIQQPVETWKAELVNDFEKIVFENYPQVKEIKESLYENGAVYASMSGSGSTVYGIYKKESAINYPAVHTYFYKLFDLA